MAIKIIDIQRDLDLHSDSEVYTLVGLSTDAKPTNEAPIAGIGQLQDESTFTEIDTGFIYRYSTVNTNPITSNGWWQI